MEDNLKIAIIDGVNQDIGLKILFPKADYFIDHTEYDRTSSFEKYNIKVNYDWSVINEKNYDFLFIVIASYDGKEGTPYFKQDIYDIMQREKEIINKNNFKKIFVFDNYDYDYDPNEIWNNDKITLFFKRNYNKNKIYRKNVIPFPFIMFGEVSLIEKCDTINLSKEEYFCPKNNWVFFSGNIFVHEDKQYGVFRNRRKIYDEIAHTICNPGFIPYRDFLEGIRTSKFCLELLGFGEPNKRTFEIILSGSLMIHEKNDLVWPFEERFSEETQFKNSEEYLKVLNNLMQNETLYNKCLEQQYIIVKKYFNIKWIKNYVVSFLQQ